jgi:HNH endonuclease
MTSYISSELRRRVADRAAYLCEYCLIHEDDTYWGCQVDHVIAEKHGGPTSEGNLAFACVFCNRLKGSDIGSLIWETGIFTRFFNPRLDHWGDHFTLHEFVIDPRTDIGRVTARIFDFNNPDRCLEREALHKVGRYPSRAALLRMT